MLPKIDPNSLFRTGQLVTIFRIEWVPAPKDGPLGEYIFNDEFRARIVERRSRNGSIGQIAQTVTGEAYQVCPMFYTSQYPIRWVWRPTPYTKQASQEWLELIEYVDPDVLRNTGMREVNENIRGANLKLVHSSSW